MTFLQIINIIKDTALAQPNVNTFVRQFIDLNREDTKYSAVVLQDRDGLRDRISEQDWNTYTFHLGYVDRLTYDESNRDDIFSTGINIINNIVASIRERWDLEVSIIDRFNTFNQRFTASCAGVYVVLAIQVPVSDCVDGEETDLYDSFDVKITENGHYHFVPDGRPVDEIDIDVDVEGKKPEDRLVETIISNGSYNYTPETGKVFSDAAITVAVPGPVLKRWRAYQEIDKTTGGVFVTPSEIAAVGADGLSEVEIEITVQAEDINRTITSNGTYDYSASGDRYIDSAHINVSVPVKEERHLIPDTITENGEFHYTPPGMSYVYDFAEIEVDVHPTERLIEYITSNGSYHYEDDYAGADITVAVPEPTIEPLVDTITSNGSYHYETGRPDVYYGDVDLSIDVHPSNTLSRSYTTNGQKTITGEFNGGTINISVHPSQKLVQTITVNGLTTLSGEWTDADITVSIPDGSFPEPDSDEIYYITYTGNVLNVFDPSDFDAYFVSNTYDSTRGFCVLKFDGPITKVGDNAFNDKPQLKKMRLPDSVTRIGSQSFKDSGIIEIQMDGVTRIDYAAFYNSYAQVTPLTIPEGCETITNNAYAYCTAAAIIEIPSTVNYIGHTAFRYCSNLESVYVYATVPPVLEDDNGTYDQFFDTDSNMTIVVPSGTLSAYQNAAGWSTYASRIVERQ